MINIWALIKRSRLKKYQFTVAHICLERIVKTESIIYVYSHLISSVATNNT